MMLNFPLADLDSAEERAQRLVSRSKETNDWLTLRQLWCLLRNEEMANAPGEVRDRLKRMRNEVAEALAGIEGTSSPEIARPDHSSPSRHLQSGGGPPVTAGLGWSKY